MSRIRDLFTRFSSLSYIRFVSVVDGHQCTVSREVVVPTSSQLTLDQVLYALDFLVNLLLTYFSSVPLLKPYTIV